MRFLLCLAFFALIGCQTTDGPLTRKHEKVDAPYFDTTEQQARARTYLPIPDDSKLGGPPTGLFNRDVFPDRVSGNGR